MDGDVTLALDDDIRLLGAVARDNPLVAFSADVIADAATLEPGSVSFQLLVTELKAAKVRIADWRAAVRARRAESEEAAPANGVNGVSRTHDATHACDVDDRPSIQIVAGELPRAVAQLRAALIADDPNLYQRAGELVMIAREPERRDPYDADERRGRDLVMRPGTPRVRPIQYQALLLRAAQCAIWQKYDKKRGEWAGADPCNNTVGALRSSPDAWTGIPPLRGILETPALAPSGRLINQPGYDEETGYVLLPTCDPGPIEDSPSREKAIAALQYLWTQMACDMPFKGVGEPAPTDPERALQWSKAREVSDAFVGVAAVLSVLARPAICGACPGFVFEAAGQGSGKTLQMHTVSVITTGRAAGVMTFPMREGKPDEPELEKVLSAYALADAQTIAFDNIRGTLGGAGLEKVLTAVDTISLRVLGASDLRKLPWSALAMFSCNNVSMNDDTAQRVVVSRIESAREDPRSRPRDTFFHPDLLEALKERRGWLVRAGLVILRSYLSARDRGETAEVDGATWGSFEAWARLIPAALRWAGGPDIMHARPEAGAGSDEEAEAHGFLLRGWPDLWQGQKASFILGEAFRNERDIGLGKAPPDGLDDVRGAIRALTRTPEGRTPSAQPFGMALKRLVGKLRDGRRLAKMIDRHTKVQTWRVEKVG